MDGTSRRKWGKGNELMDLWHLADKKPVVIKQQWWFLHIRMPFLALCATDFAWSGMKPSHCISSHFIKILNECQIVMWSKAYNGCTILTSTFGTMWVCLRTILVLKPQTIYCHWSHKSILVTNSSIAEVSEIVCREYINGLPADRLNRIGVQ